MKKVYISPMVDISPVHPLYSILDGSTEIGVIGTGDSATKQRYSEEDALKSEDQRWGDGLQKSIW